MDHKERSESYSQILRSSSIIGGGQIFSYLIGLIRIKLIAVLLGPSGVGLISLFTLITELVGSVTRFGISQSAVREIAEANGRDDTEEVTRTATAVRRACFFCGVLAWSVTAILSYPLSVWVFSSSDQSWAIAILGLAIFFTILAEGQSAILQGTRQVSLLAKVSIVTALLTTVVSVSLYAFFGETAVVPALVASAITTFLVSWWYARQTNLQKTSQPWKDTWHRTRGLLHLGLAFMWSTFMAALAALLIRTIIVRELGVEANGYYQAGWALSSIFGSVLVGAMSTDFYPRLTALVSQRQDEAVRVVNEQVQIGILIALPGMVATMILSDWVVYLFYSMEFSGAAPLLQFLLFSVFFTLISYPMGYILVATGAARRYATITTAFHVSHILGTWYLIEPWGLEGVALLNALLGFIYIFGMNALAGTLINFKWHRSTIELMVSGVLTLALCLGLTYLLSSKLSFLIGVPIIVATTIFGIRGIVTRLGPEHRIVHAIHQLPLGRVISGVRATGS